MSPSGSDRRSESLKKDAPRQVLASSTQVLLRATFKLSIFAIAASFHAAAGGGFVKQLAALTFATSICCFVLAHWRREQLLAPRLTHFDEAVWFLMLATVLRAQA